MTTVHIDKFDDYECPKGGQHDDKAGVMIYRTRKGEERFINDSKYYNGHEVVLKDGFIRYPVRKIHRRMRIIGASTACSKCGTPFIIAHNPFFL
jgi:hypothetical protein